MATAGAAAAVGLRGPLVDELSHVLPGITYPATLALGAVSVFAALPLRLAHCSS